MNSFDAVRSRLTRLTRGFIIWGGPRTQPITNSRRGISRPQLQLHDEGSAPRVEPRDSRFRHTPAFERGFSYGSLHPAALSRCHRRSSLAACLVRLADLLDAGASGPGSRCCVGRLGRSGRHCSRFTRLVGRCPASARSDVHHCRDRRGRVGPCAGFLRQYTPVLRVNSSSVEGAEGGILGS